MEVKKLMRKITRKLKTISPFLQKMSVKEFYKSLGLKISSLRTPATDLSQFLKGTPQGFAKGFQGWRL